MRIGNVAATAHQKGSVKSATSPNPAKVNQNIFLCMSLAYCEVRALFFAVPNPTAEFDFGFSGQTRQPQ